MTKNGYDVIDFFFFFEVSQRSVLNRSIIKIASTRHGRKIKKNQNDIIDYNRQEIYKRQI